MIKHLIKSIIPVHSRIKLITDSLAGGVEWVDSIDYSTLAGALKASIRVDLDVPDGSTAYGIILEQGANTFGMAVWALNGNIVCKVGGSSNGGDYEMSIPAETGKYTLEIIIDVNSKMSLYKNGVLATETNIDITKLAGSDVGGINRVHSNILANPEGWTEENNSAFTGNITKCIVWTTTP